MGREEGIEGARHQGIEGGKKKDAAWAASGGEVRWWEGEGEGEFGRGGRNMGR